MNNTTLMLFSGLMMFAVIVLCVISRQYYIDEVDELLAQTEKLHASILLQATKIRYAKDFEDRQRVLEEREAMKPPVYAKKPNFFRSDIRNIGYVLLVGFIAAICALI